MNVKINDKQMSDDRTTEEQTSDDRPLMKINPRRTAWRSLFTKFFAASDENFLVYSRAATNVRTFEYYSFEIFMNELFLRTNVR